MKTYVSDNVIEEFYAAVAKNDNRFLYSVHLPHSTVYYVREALYQKTGTKYTLGYIEWALLKEGMINPRWCYDPELQLSWNDYPHQKEAQCPTNLVPDRG